MADPEIIISLTIEGQKKIEELNKEIENLKNTQKELDKAFVEGTKKTEEYNKQSKENTKQIKINEQAIKSLTTATQAEAGSISALSAENRELIKQRNSINIKTAEGALKVAQINEKINENNLLIKTNSSTLEKNRLNVGNYRESLEGLTVRLSNIVPGLSGMTSGLSGITQGATAFTGVPFGAVLGGITVALNLAGQYLSKFTSVMDFFEDILTQVNAGFNAFVDNFDLFINLSWGELTDRIKESANEAQRLLDLQREIDERTVINQINEAKNQELLAKLNVLSRNRTKTEQERIDAIEQAIAIEKKGNEDNIKLLEDKLQLAFDNLLLSKKNQLKDTQQLIKEEQRRADNQIAQESRGAAITEKRRKQILEQRDATIERIKTENQLITQINAAADISEKLFLITKSGLFDEEKELQPVIEAYKSLYNEKAAATRIEEKALALQDQLRDKQEQNAQKLKEQEELRIKREQELELARQKGQERQEDELAALVLQLDKENEAKADADLKNALREVEENEKLNKTIAEQDEQFRKQSLAEEEKYNQQRASAENTVRNLRQQAALDTLNFVSGLLREGSKAQKVAALAEVAANVGIGITNGLRVAQQTSLAGGPAAAFAFPAFYAAQISAVLAAASKARAIIQSGNSSSGGVSSGGRSGVTQTQATTNPINQSFSMANAFRNMPPVIASWKEASEVRNRVEFKESLTTV